MTDREIAEQAEAFWRLAGPGKPFPRSLESAVSWALPLALVKRSPLEISTLNTWLSMRGVRAPFPICNRRLRACLIAKAGRGMVFLDGSDPENEQRFSLAHEIAHFLCDYLHPRENALAALGDGIRAVLDGERPPTPEEQLSSILRGVEVGTFTHLMARSPSGLRLETLEAEDRADRLALELLAPRGAVLNRLKAQNIRWRTTSAVRTASQMLKREFGLPAAVAETYGRMLVLSQRCARSFREWLGDAEE